MYALNKYLPGAFDGFSGHGFKLVSAVGEILAYPPLGERPKQAIDFLNANRFSQSGSVS
jgi:hypothetical protein